MSNLFRRIREDRDLSKLLVSTCSENNISIDFAEPITKEDYLVIKVDSFYNDLNLEVTPPSVDCLIILKCKGDSYKLVLVELKKIKSCKGITLGNMEGKFKTTIDDFISKRFKEILCIDYQKVELYFVSNIDPYKRDIGLTLEMLMSKKYHYRNKKYMINPFMPIPKIKSCY